MEQLISESLNKYLGSTKLSMGQIASRWGVSTPLLSQIKSGKKKAGLELGLKILREAGVELTDRQKWLESRKTEGEESAKIFEDIKKERTEYRLQKNICDHLTSNPILTDLFLDISLMREKGFSWSGILKNYGEYGLEQVEFLMSSGLVRKEGERYFIVQDKLPHALNAENSFGLMSGIFEIFKRKVKNEDFRGEFHFDITDVSQEGYEELKKLNIEYTKKMVAIVKKNEQPRVTGGIRVIAQNLVGILKVFIIVILTGYLAQDSYAQGNGLTGGASGKVISIDQLSVGDLISFPKGSFSYGKTPRAIIVDHEKKLKVEFKPASLGTPFFETKQDAVDGAIKLNQLLKSGSVSREEALTLARRYMIHCSAGGSAPTVVMNEIETQIRSGAIVPIGFKVEQSYTPEGKPLYRAIGNYLLPCNERD